MKELTLAAVAAVGKGIRPPAPNADPRVIVRWRWVVAVCLGATMAGLIISVALTFGFATTFHPGFVRADEWTDSRISILKKEILDTKREHCLAEDPKVRNLYLDSYNNLLIEYEKLSKSPYPYLSCADFGGKDEAVRADRLSD